MQTVQPIRTVKCRSLVFSSPQNATPTSTLGTRHFQLTQQKTRKSPNLLGTMQFCCQMATRKLPLVFFQKLGLTILSGVFLVLILFATIYPIQPTQQVPANRLKQSIVEGQRTGTQLKSFSVFVNLAELLSATVLDNTIPTCLLRKLNRSL